MNKEYRPDWVPENAGSEFASHVKKGIGPGSENVKPSSRTSKTSKRIHSANDYISGILGGNRTLLAQAITLIESNAPQHHELAQVVLSKLLPHTGNSIRIGITGIPGVGKSTFIEALGIQLCDQGNRLAVLTIDPSSTLSKGSILGDKTRMENLAKHPNAFIRPSPTGGTLGGVANKTRETILLCEAFGFDTIFVETVGVGQSEITVRSLVDFFMLLLLPGAGDELQGIKKGVVEIADALVINKADGDFETPASRARSQYANVLQYFQPATQGWKTPVLSCSALHDQGIDKIWETVLEFMTQTQESNVFVKRRQTQSIEWVHTLVNEHLYARFYQDPQVKVLLPKLEAAVLNGELSPTLATERLLKIFAGPSNHPTQESP